jgi:TIR domain
LWGKDLYEHLADVYSNQAHFCIMLISASYAKKAWTNHERKNAQARAFREHREYILPVRLDDTMIPGIAETIGYIDFSQSSPGEIADLVQQKLGRAKILSVHTVSNVRKKPSPKTAHAVPLPRVRRDFTQRQKDKFLREAFTFVKQYFKKVLVKLEESYPEIETDFLEVNSVKFICKIYFHGDIKNQCKIWLGGFSSTDSICYYEGRLDIGSDSAYNDWLRVEDDGFELHLALSGMWYGQQPQESTLTKEKAAEYLWRRFSVSLER